MGGFQRGLAMRQVRSLDKEGSLFRSKKPVPLLNCTAVNSDKKLRAYFKDWTVDTHTGASEASKVEALKTGDGSMTLQFLKKAKVISSKRRKKRGRGRKQRSRKKRGGGLGNARRHFNLKESNTPTVLLYKTMLCLTRVRANETECCVTKSIVTQPERLEAAQLSEIERKYTTNLKLW